MLPDSHAEPPAGSLDRHGQHTAHPSPRSSASSAPAPRMSRRRRAAASAGTSTSAPPFFRLGFVVLTLLGGAGILVYLAAVLVIPEEGERPVDRGRRRSPSAATGPGRSSVSASSASRSPSCSHAPLWPGRRGWVLVLVAGLVVLWMSRRERKRRAHRRRGVRASSALVARGGRRSDVVAFSWFNVSLWRRRRQPHLPAHVDQRRSSPNTNSASATYASTSRRSVPSRRRRTSRRRSGSASCTSSSRRTLTCP